MTRRGELCALRWADVDFHDQSILIKRAIVDAGGRLVEKDTKTRVGGQVWADVQAEAGVPVLRRGRAHRRSLQLPPLVEQVTDRQPRWEVAAVADLEQQAVQDVLRLPLRAVHGAADRALGPGLVVDAGVDPDLPATPRFRMLPRTSQP